MTAALEGGEWSAARPGRTSLSEKTRYPFYRRLDGPQGRFGRAENLDPTGIRFRNIIFILLYCNILYYYLKFFEVLIFKFYKTLKPHF